MIIQIPLGEWLPDAPDLKTGGLIVAKNVYPTAGGYAPMWGGVSQGTIFSASEQTLGAARFETSYGVEKLVFGLGTDLVVRFGGAEYASGLVRVPSGINWSFAQYGQLIYATHSQNGTYYLDNVDSDVIFSTAPGSPPRGRAIGKVDDFLMIGGLVDIDASGQPYRVRWSQFNDPTATWGTDLAAQSGFVDMPADMGFVTGISGGDIGLIFQERGVSRIDYVGGATAFQKTLISNQVGCEGHSGIVAIEGRRYWVSRGGIAMSDGDQVSIISTAKIWDWVLERTWDYFLNQAQGVINWERRCILWNLLDKVVGSGAHFQLIYAWELDQWSYSTVDADYIFQSDYNNSLGIAGVLDGVMYNYGDTATSPEATLTTGEFQLEPGRRSYVTGVRPLVESANADSTIKLGYRNQPGETVTETAATAQGTTGMAPVIADGRYMRVTLTRPASTVWDKAHGLEVEAAKGGVL